MKKIRIYFTDFWPSFNCKDNWIYHVLSKIYDVEISKDTPDYLFYSVFGHEYSKYNCIRIFYTGENVHPNFRMCDYAIGFDYIEYGDRYVRYPHWRLYREDVNIVRKGSIYQAVDVNKRKFCNFIYSNEKASTPRDAFFYRLSEYKKVDSGGKHLNNIGISVKDKIEWCSQYKFSIAFENTSVPGYATEKLLQAFAANTIPIYFGDPTIAGDFNSNAFINCHEYDSFDDVICKIKELDNDEGKYLKMLEEEAINECVVERMDVAFKDFLRNIFDQDYEQAFRKCRDINIYKQESEKLEKIVVYGIGNIYEEFKAEIEKQFEIVALTSSDLNEKVKCSNYIENTKLCELNYDYILVCSNYETDIVNLLVDERGISHDRILLKDMVFRQKEMFFTQYNENVVMYLLLNKLAMDYTQISKIKYIEIGVGHPICYNFTFSLYMVGADGVLVESDHDLGNLIKIARPRDCLISDITLANTEDSSAFINALLENVSYIPEVVSINSKSNGLEILRRINYNRIRPLVVVAGTGTWGNTDNSRKKVASFMQTNGYLMMIYNGTSCVFVDGNQVLEQTGNVRRAIPKLKGSYKEMSDRKQSD